MKFSLLFVSLASTSAQFCTNTCPPINFGAPVPSLCEGDTVPERLVSTTWDVCHPKPTTWTFGNKITVLANFYIGCNAGRRESGVFAHTAQKYYNSHGIEFITSLKGGSTCNQWADIYQSDALQLFGDSDVVPTTMPLTVLDQSYALRDAYFTTPFGHPAYVILDASGVVRHKFIGPCCGYEQFSDCTPDIARQLDTTISEYLDALILEQGETTVEEEPSVNDDLPPPATTVEPDQEPVSEVCEFSEWSPCSVTCGKGQQFRTQFGPKCPTLVDTRECDTDIECSTCVFGNDPVVTVVAKGFDGARDVAFSPVPGQHLGTRSEGRDFHNGGGDEAWVLNALNHSVSIVSAVGTEHQTTISRRDRGYYHYMINATALSFNMVGDSGREADRDTYGYWAVCNDNRNTYLDAKEPSKFKEALCLIAHQYFLDNFMGPTLYNSHPENRNLVNRLGDVCGVDEECFFLHADMLHEAPACIGIVHDPETVTAYGTVYWAFDATGNQESGQLVRFDFQQPHGPGSMDHSVASIRRFPQVQLTRADPGIHAGMVVHKASRQLLVAVPGENRIISVHTDTGDYARTAREEYPIFSNRLPSFEYSIWECPEQYIFADNIDTPSGMVLSLDEAILYVAERGTGDILAFEVASGSLLSRKSTGKTTLAGLSVSPSTGDVFFVDEESNELLKISQSSCETEFESRVSSEFANAFEEANALMIFSTGTRLSMHKDYSCTSNPQVPDAAYFDQVHVDTGYASDDPNVQSMMPGMDEAAALLRNRTDCGYTSELNFDSLLLGGYFCHTCLPGSQGAECDPGGACTNIQWLGYTCDNEFLVYSDDVLELRSPQKANLNESDVVLKRGVTYRFTIRGSNEVCLKDGSSSAMALPGNPSGCATSGPLLVSIDDAFPSTIRLSTSDGSFIELQTTSEWGPIEPEKAEDPVDDKPEDDGTTSATEKSFAVKVAVGMLLTSLF